MDTDRKIPVFWAGGPLDEAFALRDVTLLGRLVPKNSRNTAREAAGRGRSVFHARGMLPDDRMCEVVFEFSTTLCYDGGEPPRDATHATRIELLPE